MRTGLIRLVLIVGCWWGGLMNPSWAAISRDAVVKVFVTSNPMDYYRPWQAEGTNASSGSGCIIAGNRILTNAHVVSNSTFIQVRKESDPRRFTAQVEAIGNDCDLAILTVNDPQFFSGITPFEMGELPDLQDTVVVIGFPLGGDKLSITTGVVSRIEINAYVQSAKKLLTVQIDAAINPGNSGGPVLLGDQMVGIAMQIISESQNIGYMIPTLVINHFLKDVEDGKYEGFPILGVEFDNTENKTLRAFYQMPDKLGGVRVNHVLPFSSSDGFLREGDIITAIDDIALGVDGTFEFRQNERLLMSQLINDKYVGENIDLTVLRQGALSHISFPLKPYVGLIPFPNYFKKPPYYIYGGIVFTVLSADLFRSWGKDWWEKAPMDFLNYLIGKGRLNEDQREEVVVVLEILPDDITVGYHSINNEVIAKVNGKTFRSFKEFVTMLEANNGEFTIFETDQKKEIILPKKDIEKITQNIIERNNIPKQFSDDVAEWIKNGKNRQ